MRIVTWNIEKGKRWPLLERCLSHETIRTADILCLNEVDEGMARSGNLRIGHEIGKRLGMEVVFGHCGPDCERQRARQKRNRQGC